MRLRSDVARAWAASGDWAPGALAKLLQDATIDIKRDVRRHFMYTAPLRRSENLLPDTSPRSEELCVRAREFFRELADETFNPPSSCSYFTAPVAEIEAGSLLGCAPGWEEALSTGLTSKDPRALKPWLQLWAGSAGATTQAHYDRAAPLLCTSDMISDVPGYDIMCQSDAIIF